MTTSPDQPAPARNAPGVQTIVLTGASRGIGHATVKRFRPSGLAYHHLQS